MSEYKYCQRAKSVLRRHHQKRKIECSMRYAFFNILVQQSELPSFSKFCLSLAIISLGPRRNYLLALVKGHRSDGRPAVRPPYASRSIPGCHHHLLRHHHPLLLGVIYERVTVLPSATSVLPSPFYHSVFTSIFLYRKYCLLVSEATEARGTYRPSRMISLTIFCILRVVASRVRVSFMNEFSCTPICRS